jgi:hypothetical protein
MPLRHRDDPRPPRDRWLRDDHRRRDEQILEALGGPFVQHRGEQIVR